MRIDELLKKIQKNIKNNLSHKDLLSLCGSLGIQINGRKSNIQERLIEYSKNQDFGTLLMISNLVDEYMKVNKTRQSRPTENIITDRMLRSAPINLEDEIPTNVRSDLVVPIHTSFSSNGTALPTQSVTGVNERVHHIRIPNVLQSVTISTSPFYKCSVCLHPLTLMIPQYLPNIATNSKNMSNYSFNFILTENVKQILAKNQLLVNGKPEYKWQILLRFISIDPNQTIPNGDSKVTEMIPPYLNVTINNVQQPLWDILPSNCRTKEGKRHAKPVPISEKMSESFRLNNGYKQIISINWWQTPGVFLYYYVGVYLERKINVREMMNLYTSGSAVNKHYEETMKLIQNKLGDASKSSRKDRDEDDDLVISNVLPINLCCPVGKSRIMIPLRTVTCQHLQCFDAHLFLSMNERRPVWKCPVCDNSATPDDLFCDKFFERILNHFKDDDEVTDVNVHSDFSFVAMKRNRDRGEREKCEKAASIQASAAVEVKDTSEQDLIVLDSDEEADSAPITKKSAPAPLPTTIPPAPPKEPAAPVSTHSSQSDRTHDNRPKTVNQSSTMPNAISSRNSESSFNDIDKINCAQQQNGGSRLPFGSVSTPSVTSQSNRSSNSTPSVNNAHGDMHRFTSGANRQTQPVIQQVTCVTTTVPIATSIVTGPSTMYPQSRNNNSIISTSPSVSNIFNPRLVSSNRSTHTSTPSPTGNVLSTNSPISTPRFVQTTIPASVGSPISVLGNLPKPTGTTLPTFLNTTTKQTTPLSTTAQKTAPLLSDFLLPETISVEEALSVTARKQKEFSITKPSAIDNSIITSGAVTTAAGNTTAAVTASVSQSVSKSRVDQSPQSHSSTINVTSAPGPKGTGGVHTANNNESTTNSENVSIIRSLPVEVSLREKSKNLQTGRLDFTDPIACPGLMVPMSPSSAKDSVSPPVSISQPVPLSTAKSDNSKNSKPVQNSGSVPVSGVVIPAVLIDLTEDDEAPHTTQTIPLKNSVPFPRKALNENHKWIPVMAPVGPNMKGNRNGLNSMINPVNRFSYYDKSCDSNKRSMNSSINHFKPHIMKYGANNNLPNRPPASKVQSSQPIDLTGDDEDDGNSGSETDEDILPKKKLKSTIEDDTEDGQVDDSESEDSLSDSPLSQHYSRQFPVSCKQKK